MIARAPAVPTPPSTALTLAIIWVLILIAVGVCWWNWRHAEPVGTPPPVEPLKAITDGFNTHAETAAALTIDPWLPLDVDPRDDGGVLVEPPPWLAKDVVHAPVLSAEERTAYLRIAARLLLDPEFTSRIDHILEIS